MGASRRVVVVGGGIAGLCAAHAAAVRAGERGTAAEIVVLERSDRFGGNLRTERVDGFLMDAGADSWVVTKPEASALARELGLGGSLIGTQAAHRRYYVVWDGRLHAVPEGLVLGVPTRIAPLVMTSLFSWAGKLRMACEPMVARRAFEGDDDESIAEFATRRLGHEAADRLVAPLLGGISGGEASEISVRASFPQLVDIERRHGSLVRGMREVAAERRRAQSSGAGGGSAFVSLREGVGALPAALAERLQGEGVTLRTGATVEAIERATSGWIVRVAAGDEPLAADAVLVALPTLDASRLVGALEPAVAHALDAVAYGSTVTVFLGYRRADVAHPLDGVGFVVPRSSGRTLLAGTWVSSKWEGRAPEAHVLLRAFFGGASAGGLLAAGDEAVVAAARAELRALMGLDAEPVMTRVYRFARGSAQMRVGHIARMRAARQALERVAPGLFIAGGGYDGVGIPDCVRQGTDAGRAMIG